MRRFFLTFLICSILINTSNVLWSQSSETGGPDERILELYAENAAQDGILGESYVLMHNRKGIRIEYNINKKRLQLWTSPLAGVSLDIADRNFSNRDDYTKIFDKINFPQLSNREFIKCDYDAFHSILYFQKQTVHIVSIFDKAAVMVWFEKPGLVDIKTDKQDQIITNNDKTISSSHPDRGKTLSFVAKIGKGNGYFVHQRISDPIRSHFSRAHLDAGQAIFLCGDDVSQNISAIAEELSKNDAASILKDTEIKIKQALNTGSIHVRNNTELQKLIDVNKRIILAMQDESGAQRAALKYIYYLIWHRDGAMTSCYDAYTGWVWPLEKWTAFEMANPTIRTNNGKTERFFGQLVSKNINKLEEDGPFYGIWSAFTYWTQTGDDRFCKGENLNLLEENISWLENNFFDSKRGMFFRYHYCEAPYTNSPGDGWDDAVGYQTDQNISKWKNDTIINAYDIYMNSICYANYIMMAAMEKGIKSDEYLKKGNELGNKLKPFFAKQNKLPDYGDLTTIKGKTVTAGPYGMDQTDYIWAFSLPLFYPDYENLPEIRDRLLAAQKEKPKGYFLAGWFCPLAAMDIESNSEDSIMNAMKYLIPQNVESGKYLKMPYAIKELVDTKDGDMFHDVRPNAFSIGSWFATISNLGLKRFPFGIAVRSTKYLDSINQYQYKNSLIDIIYNGEGRINGIKINGQTLEYSYQIPEDMLKDGENRIDLLLKKLCRGLPILLGSTVRLENIEGSDRKVIYHIEAYGKNVLMFRNVSNRITVTDSTGKNLEVKINTPLEVTYVEFQGKGKCTVIVE